MNDVQFDEWQPESWKKQEKGSLELMERITGGRNAFCHNFDRQLAATEETVCDGCAAEGGKNSRQEA